MMAVEMTQRASIAFQKAEPGLQPRLSAILDALQLNHQAHGLEVRSSTLRPDVYLVRVDSEHTLFFQREHGGIRVLDLVGRVGMH